MSLKAFAVPLAAGTVLHFLRTAVTSLKAFAVTSLKAFAVPLAAGTVLRSFMPMAAFVRLSPVFTLREGPGFGKDPSSFAVRLAEIAVSPASGTGFRVVCVILVFHFVPPIDNS